MVILRQARAGDIPAIRELALEALARTPFADVEFDTGLFNQELLASMRSPNRFLRVAENDRGEIVGVLLGEVGRIYGWAKAMAATDRLFYVSEEKGMGCGREMLKAFLQWARARTEVVVISMQLGSQVGDWQRVGRLYERAGLKLIGGIYQERIVR
ncbi:MAG: hypothetical protein HQL56_06920 [Magnetococcales bacterium]|nr:hypothetical protein [Magnetococcales bacterium]